MLKLVENQMLKKPKSPKRFLGLLDKLKNKIGIIYLLPKPVPIY
jgi:hypothetical protein